MTAPTEDEIARAAAAALRGELIVLPTDTVYGIGTRPDDPAATGRLFDAKRRPRDLELPVLAPSLAAAADLGRIEGDARLLAERFWPGPLTLVVQRRSASRSWQLGGNQATIGLRVPDDPTALALLRRTGPLAVSSANLSGQPTPTTCGVVADVFGDIVAVALCAEAELSGAASTVVDCTRERPTVLRPGAVRDTDIGEVVPEASNAPAMDSE